MIILTRFDAAAGLAKILNKDFWAGAYFNIGTRNSCVLCLPFEDGAGYVVTDVSGYGNNGAIYPAAGTFTFGRTTTGSEDYAGTANYKYASTFTAANSGFLTKITARCKRSSSGKMRAALYADNAGAPGALIAQTLEVTVGTSTGWVKFPFDAAAYPTVVNGTAYWLAISSAANFTLRDQSGAGPAVNYNADTYSDGFAISFGSPSTTASKQLCIYATGSNPLPNWVAGKWGNALSFDGSTQYVLVPNNSTLEITQVTVMCWVYNLSGIAGGRPLISAGWGDAYSLYLDMPAGTIVFSITDQVNNKKATSTTIVKELSSWHHLAGTFDGTFVKIYVDGQLEQSVDITGTSISGWVDLAIMQMWGGYTSGILDETRVFNRALTAGEIAFFYSGKPHGCNRQTDRGKRRSKVRLRGVDRYGNKITSDSAAAAKTSKF